MEHTVVSIRRYPVKSMGGESLVAVELDSRGLAGDREYAVRNQEGKLASGKNGSRFRRYDAVFDYTARTREGTVWVAGGTGTWVVGDPDLNRELSRAFGAPVEVTAESDAPHFDGGAVSVIGTATLQWMAQQWGIHADPRRLRVNLLLQTEEPFIEETWIGHSLAIGATREGAAEVVMEEKIPRCRTVDVDQDGTRAAGRMLPLLGRYRELCVAVYARVSVPGRIAQGDRVWLGEPSEVA
ncbi:MOSC domain-containing protein [Nesterenkonia sphaerica]|uniref:MOSC domain-containing protein n=1 Tax=Nesterenkonia sphaerica TaxID=1804988 RepID=A0A5R9AJJ1_9MICC|nr:MOSC N-terminal beta barrel domain-containing protein [Nesterenkonia sphaerica]TLP78959.1 MOSC domain-containing protein [Nesterenkonia sphaerica]